MELSSIFKTKGYSGTELVIVHAIVIDLIERFIARFSVLVLLALW